MPSRPYGREEMMSSIKQIAEMTGLSMTTVSHAINGTRTVSQKSLSRIEEAIKKTNYRPNLAAQMMKTNRSKTVAIIIPETEPNNSTNCFYFDVLNGVKSCLEAAENELIVSTYPEYEVQRLANISVLQRRWVDGIILVPATDRYEDLAPIQRLGLPLVLADRWVEGCELPQVYSNNREVSADAVRLLYDSGARRIAFVGSVLQNSTAIDRYRGYCDAIRDLGMALDEALICRMPKYSMEFGYEAMQNVLRQDADAVFIANSTLCLGGMKRLMEEGMRVPDEVAIIGFDDYAWTEITTPPLTAVTQDANLMGRRAGELLLKIIAGEKPEQARISIPARLAIRSSHGPKHIQ